MKPYQTTMFTQLDADVVLEPHVVLIDDPRWDTCLREATSAPWVCVDCEFHGPSGPWGSRRDIDYWKSSIRLIQLGLPSGHVLVFDLGGLLDDRSAKRKQHASALDVIRQVIENPKVPKAGMALLTEYLLFRIHLGWKMRCMRDMMIMSQVVWAGVASKVSRWTDNGLVMQAVFRHNMAAICDRLEIPVDKTEQTSDWAGHLSNKQFNYAARDVIVPRLAWVKLAALAKQGSLMNSLQAECDAQPAFCECEYNGLPIDIEMAREDLAKWEQVRAEFLKPFTALFPHVNPSAPMQVATALTEALDTYLCDCGYEYDPLKQEPHGQPLSAQPAEWKCPRCSAERGKLERTNTRSFLVEKPVRGKISLQPETSDNVLSSYEDVWYVNALLEGRSTAACMNWLRAAVEHAFVAPDGGGIRIRADFKQIAGGYSEHGSANGEAGAGMGRSSASRPINTQNPSNLQPSHEKAGAPSVRRCIRPRADRAFIVADLSQAHGRIAAQWSHDPVMLEAFNRGEDFHLAMTHRLLVKKGFTITLDEARDASKNKANPLHREFKSRRQGCKSTNYACVPLDSRALTRQGWRTYDQLRVGEDILAYDPALQRNVWTPLLATNVYENSEIYRITFGQHWEMRCTLDHRWYGTTVRPNPGYFQRQSKKLGLKPEYYIYTPAVRVTSDIPKQFRVRVSAPADGGPGLGGFPIPREKYGYDWVALVLRMTPEERRAFLMACLISEGNLHGKHKTWMLAQKPNELGEAMLLASYLEGSKVTVGTSRGDKGPLWRINLNTTDVATGQKSNLIYDSNAPVWCPTTALGTWVMRQGERITITGNSLNMSGVNTLKRQMATMPVPVHMPDEEVKDLIDTWVDLYHVLRKRQKEHIRRVNANTHSFKKFGVEGEYGESRALTGRRLYIVKEWQPPRQWPDGTWSEGKWSVKGTEAVSSVWMMTEADIVKRAMGWLVEVFDAHPEWDVRWSNMAHDEIDLDCIKEHALAVATVVMEKFHAAMRWAGIVDVPVDEPGASPEKLIKIDWSAK